VLTGGNAWWRKAVVYQVYVRSFCDSDGDGTGDIGGVRSKLDYLRQLGVDALWFNPWYPSPMVDSGYDVSDYRSIDPLFGDLADAELLISEANAIGIRTIVDIVPNHVSVEHRWFRAALGSAPGSKERARFWFRPGCGPSGDLPPNGWQSIFGGAAWSRTKNSDGSSGEWYLHLFAPEQPDLNWTHPDVWREHEDVLRFWFDRGVAGFRIDSAALLVKDPELAEEGPGGLSEEHPFTDRDSLHDVYREWRKLADSYREPRVLIGEVWLPDASRLARYLRPDELHTVFNFPFLSCPWDGPALRKSVDETLASHQLVGAPATWVLSNHDVTRVVTRYGRADTSFSFESRRAGLDTDLQLGTRRARAAALLTMALPGSMYIYQGEELGLPEVEDIPVARRQDPMFFRSGHLDPGRDGCRVPLPWSGDEPPYGFSPPGASRRPWLDQPRGWGTLTVAAESANPNSMLTLYRHGLELRKTEPGLAGESLVWIQGPPTVLAFSRGRTFVCIVNLGTLATSLPTGAEVLLASDPIEGGQLAPDTAVWLRTPTVL
jgi:alpha-glucosidase